MSDAGWMMICNVLKLALFVALAMYFGHWWIVFFVVIFWTYIERGEGNE